MTMRNRLANTKNEFQGKYKRVLCVCSAGLLRSPTAALVLSQEPFNYNTRAVGIVEEYALIMMDSAHLYWAQEIVCMQEEHKKAIEFNLKRMELETPVICLDVPDNFSYRDPELMELIREAYQKATTGTGNQEEQKTKKLGGDLVRSIKAATDASDLFVTVMEGRKDDIEELKKQSIPAHDYVMSEYNKRLKELGEQ